MTYLVGTTVEADKDLASIKHKQTRDLIIDRLIELQVRPEEQGKPMRGKLAGQRSVRAAKNRYRVIYIVRTIPEDTRTDPNDEGVVTVTVIGIRKQGDKRDVYELAEKRLG
jgi:mRNA interferase RelE/StbE